MNNFFKTFWAALLAFVVGSIVFAFLTILIIGGIIASFGASKTASVSPSSVLVFDLGSYIVDSPGNKLGTLDISKFSYIPSNTLLEVLQAIEVAEKDDRIKGIYINLTGMGSMGIAHAEEIRAAIQRFKDNSGKFVLAYNEDYSQLGYYFASAADHVAINPEGSFDWRGLAANVLFYKGLLDKLDVNVEIFRHGTFKSAVEPFMTDRMSPDNRLQTETYVNSMWGLMLDEIAASRGLTKEQLHDYASTLAVKSPAAAKELGLVDDILYEDQVNSLLAALIDGSYDEEFEPADGAKAPALVTMSDYISDTALTVKRISKNKIAVVYADGNITSGESYQGVVGSATVAKLLAGVRKDKNVKAVVFRVNSPGGSALASEVMWREVELLRQEKPVIVSMGEYAASGGYYISCGADAIIADRSTLTGSIGVFGMMLDISKTLKNKLGITVDVVRSAPHGDLGMPFRGVTRNEAEFWQYQVESVYGTFIGHVANGRNMTVEAVDAIGQGRVWLGADALEIGLVDGHGGLADAISLAAERAGISNDFRIFEALDERSQIEVLIEALFSAEARGEARLRNELGDLFLQYSALKNMLEETGVQARLPYTVEFN